ncbi:MAG: branched-chain amino acid ABC transporter permease [Nitrospinota bacterium]
MKNKSFFWVAIGVVVLGFALTGVMENRYYYKAGYIVLQFVVLATAWNILGGYTGYVNFGSGAFFGIGAYTAVALIKTFNLSLPFLLISGGVVAALLGLGIGYLTLRLKGIFFSIATLALAVVLEMLVVNWEYVGGGAGIPIVHPREPLFFSNYDEFLFFVMLVLAVVALAIARFIENSRIGRGMAAIRDSEEAAECMGVPTLKLKLFATTVSGFLMGMAGAPFPYYVTYVEPSSAFDLNYAVNSLAMPMIGGTATWIGPLVGAGLLATAQQWATVTVSSEMNLLIVGVLLVGFVVFAPEGLVGLFRKIRARTTGKAA